MITITSIEGNSQKLDGGSMFGNAPRAVWERWTPPDSQGRIDLSCRSFLIDIDGTKVLLETGIGAFFEPKMADRFGVQNKDVHMLRENLKKHGTPPEDVDYIILSHLHFDHAGGLLPPFAEGNNQDLIFTKAKFIVGKKAWERALHPHSRDRASFIPGLTDKLKNSGRLVLVDSVKDLPAALQPHLDFIFSDGHTPGQMLTLVKGEDKRALFTGDLVPGSHWVHLPITMGYDRFPEAVIDEKQNLYSRAVPEHWILLFTHDPDVAGATVQGSDSQKYEMQNSFKNFDSFQI